METVDHHFVLVGAALEKLKGVHYSLKAPVQIAFLPARGDIVKFPGLESFSFYVVGRKIEFAAEKVKVTHLLDIADQNTPEASLKLVK